MISLDRSDSLLLLRRPFTLMPPLHLSAIFRRVEHEMTLPLPITARPAPRKQYGPT